MPTETERSQTGLGPGPNNTEAEVRLDVAYLVDDGGVLLAWTTASSSGREERQAWHDRLLAEAQELTGVAPDRMDLLSLDPAEVPAGALSHVDVTSRRLVTRPDPGPLRRAMVVGIDRVLGRQEPSEG